MGPQQLDLRDIHLPENMGWWPPAIGWWLLAILIPLFFFFIYWLYKRVTRQTALKTAKKHLLNIKQNKTLNNMEILIALSQLLRRVAISISSREHAASLTGQAWLDYLNSTMTGSPFSESAGSLLVHAHYKNNAPSDIERTELIKLCENWLKTQKERKK